MLPDDLVDYRRPGRQEPIVPDEFAIADAVRMSMSIPYLFEPIVLEDLTGSPCTIIDGGTLSNFPVWIFDVDPSRAGRKPSRPTFGFTLVGGHSVGDSFADVVRRAPWPVRLAADVFSTAQDAWDARFASHSTSVRTIAISAVDVGTTDSDLDAEAQGELIANGREAVREYLRTFDPDTYVNTFGASLEATPVTGSAGRETRTPITTRSRAEGCVRDHSFSLSEVKQAESDEHPAVPRAVEQWSTGPVRGHEPQLCPKRNHDVFPVARCPSRQFSS